VRNPDDLGPATTLLADVPPGRRATVLLAAFQGWNDAAESASDALVHLHRLWNATSVTALSADDYYDFQSTRPSVHFTNDGRHEIQWPTTRIAKACLRQANLDVVFVHGVEPSYRWKSFSAEIIAQAQALNVDYVILVAALLADVPHTRPIPIATTSDDPDLQRRLDLEVSDYEGPTGIVGVLADAFAGAGVPTLSIWAAAPHYAADAPSPKVKLALVQKIADLLRLPVDTSELVEDAAEWQAGADEAVEQDPQVAEYVQHLEEARDAAELPESSGESLAEEFERYLKGQDGNQ
jgi:PAC2 family